MSDTLLPEKRSWNMSRIYAKDTSIEIKVRKRLFRDGFRYRKNVSTLPGKPDIVLPKYKTVIFVHGCFWHRHKGCKDSTIPKTRSEFWNKKFSTNITNDQKNEKLLSEMGWNVVVLWECEINKNFEDLIYNLESKLLVSTPTFIKGSVGKIMD